MDHLTGILDRAERDGAVRRLRTTPEPLPTIRPNPGPSPVIEMAQAVAVEPAAQRVRTLAARLDPIVVAGAAPDSPAAEKYRGMRTRILHAGHGAAVRVLLVTSPGENEGKSVTAANLAVSLAQGHERRVCLVDANLRAPRIARMFGIPTQPGLSELLSGRNTLDEALVNLEGTALTILSAGTSHPRPAELLATSAMRRTIDELRSQFDFVVVDTPGIQPLADVSSLAPFVDSVLLVARTGVTSKTAVREAASALGSTTVLGIVLNEAA